MLAVQYFENKGRKFVNRAYIYTLSDRQIVKALSTPSFKIIIPKVAYKLISFISTTFFNFIEFANSQGLDLLAENTDSLSFKCNNSPFRYSDHKYLVAMKESQIIGNEILLKLLVEI